jgi:membrane fusion protein, multidrug efflux system
MQCPAFLPLFCASQRGLRHARSTMLLAVILCALACQPAQEAQAPGRAPGVAVEVAPVQAVVPNTQVHANGILSAADEQRLSFKIGGVIASFAVENGQRVRAGQVLAALDTTEVAASVAQARAQRDKAERDFARAEQLFRDDVIPRAERDDAQTARDVARAQLRAIDFNKDFSRIVAQADGVVLRTFVEAREIVSAGQPILALASNQTEKRVKVALSDRDALRLQLGDSAEVRFDALPDQVFVARVQTLAGASNPQTGLFEIELALTLDAEQLALNLTSGLVADVAITPSAQSRARASILIPLGALVEAKNSQARVFVTEGNTAKSRQIQIAGIERDHVRVLAGLNVGESLVVRGGPYLDEGSTVRIQADGTAP